MRANVSEIVITGGPCSGKTTGMNYLAEKLRDRGIWVLVAPEVATMLIGSGIQNLGELAQTNSAAYYAIEEEMFRMQQSLRARYQSLGSIVQQSNGHILPTVILYDRAEMDVAAYLPNGRFDAMLADLGTSRTHVRDTYNGVVHMVTAAHGAEDFYTTANNPARRETMEEARAACDRTRDVWVGQPHLRVIDNSTDFEGKMKRVLQQVSRMIGIPVPLEVERKFLLRERPVPSLLEQCGAQAIGIEQIYLAETTADEQMRIRKRGQDGAYVCYRTHKVGITSRKRTETEEMITAREYHHLASTLADPTRRPIRKTRYCFLYQNQYFELDVLQEPSGKVLLEIELTEENDAVELPDFLDVEREVTDDPSFTNYALAAMS